MERKVEVSNLEQQNTGSEEETANTEETDKKEESPETEEIQDTQETETEENVENTGARSKEDEGQNEEARDENSAGKAPGAEAESSEDEQSAEPVEEEVETEATQEEAAEEEDAATDESEESAGEEVAEEEQAESVGFYSDIVERAEELVVQTDWTFVSTELANLAQDISEGPEAAGEKSKELIEKFETLRSDFEEKKKAHYEELNRKKSENLAKKKELIKQLSDIVSEEKWSATKEVGKIRSQWDSIKVLPQGGTEELDKRYKELTDEFDDHKVDRLVKKLEKEEENLELKLLLLDKMEALIKQLKGKGADFDSLSKQFDDLTSQWRKVGRVPSDKNDAVWDRFNKAQDDFNDERFKHDEKYRKKIEKALGKKKNLLKEAEALVDRDNIAQAARKVNKLHKAWKKAGNLPQRDENEMWDKFKSAIDAFNEKKSENIDLLREQEEKNLEKKYDLIRQAEEIKDTDDFEKGHQQMQSLMDRWKNAGPVPRKKSSKIWKKFKGAMDEFYDRRREHFKDRREDQKENLEEKKKILEKLEELGSHDDPALAVEEAKKLQARFKDIGYVPIKMKNKIWKQYREACDVIYDRYRALGSDLGMERKLAKQGVDPEDRKEIIKAQKEISKLKKEISRLEEETIQYQEAQTYFKPTNKGNALRDELQQKIEKAESALDEKQERLYELEKKIDQLKRSPEKETESEED